MTADRVEWGSRTRERRRDQIIGVTPFGRPAANLVVGVARAGGLGVLDLGRDRTAALAALEQVGRWWQGQFAVRIAAGCPVAPEELSDAVDTVLADSPVLPEVQPYLRGRRLLAEVVDPGEAAAAVGLGASGLIARGAEAGGRVGELTTFVLLQALLGDARLGVPVWAAGGIGPHTAAAAVAGGAAGVVLDSQLALVREMDLPAEVAAALAAMDGGETVLAGGYRLFTRPDLPVPEAAAVPARLGAQNLRTQLLPVGQEGAFAGPLAARYKTAGGVVQAVREQIADHLRAAVRTEPLAPVDSGGGRRYPILQGPMTQVTDRASFAATIAQDGGLPFLAPALMTGEQTRRLLTDTAERLGERPWGVGILGFAPPELRAAQLDAVREARPPYALIAGARPAQTAPLEEAGISTYLHVPSPGLLERFLAEGARKFVFEGMECGGHVGPRASFPLWEAQVELLLAFTEADPGSAAELRVAFAGGIHDERSAAMVAALAGPLAERGARIQVLMGTAYLFTYEAVAAGAILPGFQQAAVECDRTVLLETSPGHATRCARTPYVDVFEQTRSALEAAGTERQEMWAQLEELNLGRSRMASKGLRRDGDRLVTVAEEEQRREGMYMIGQVAALRSGSTSITGLHEQVSTGATRFLSARAATLGMTEPERPAAEPLDVAIVGMACVFPQARDAGQYWANILGGVDAVTEVPAERWDPRVYWDPESESGEKTPSKWGGFLPDVPFDALAYGIPPNALASIEPVQLLALEVAARALADAGYADRPFDRSRTSVFFGAETGTDLATAYGTRSMLPAYFGELPEGLGEQLPKLTEDSFPGILANVIAGRIVNRLDLGGANFTVDAACAASLAALDIACRELAAGTSDMVLCGGADLHNSVNDFLLFSSAHALSRSGRCAAFSDDADGITLGEGVACVVLKRLADAERDGDRVYAVVKSVAGSSDGRTLGHTAPRKEGQRLALERAYARAGVSPAQVGLVEAHGTGTAAGDRVELQALTETFTEAGARPGGSTLGSVKSQIGHTRCAAGLAGLIKSAYALYTGVRPGTLHLHRPIPAWDPETSPFALDRTPRPWAAAPAHRFAGVSAFGFGGANFHAVLAGYDGAPEPVSGLAEWPAELFLIRGADRAAAGAELDRLDALRAAGTARLRDLARTFATGTAPVQVAFVATGLEELAAKIEAARRLRPAPGVFVRSADTGAADGKVAFLYPGQGSQRPGMLAGLFMAFPRLQRLLRLSDGRYAEKMFPPAAYTEAEEERRRQALADTRVAQPTLGIAGLAMHRLLTELGVRPDMAGGHSYGELVALCAAGVFDETDLVELSAARAEAILRAASGTGAADPGTMATAAGTLEEVRAALHGIDDVVVAHHDAPRQVVISGGTAAVERALAALADKGLAAGPIPVPCAFHSPLVAGASALLRTELAGRGLCSPAFPVWSNTTAAPYDTEPERLAGTLAGQVATPVRFVEQIEAMYAAGARIFVEAGPGQALSGLVGEILAGRPHLVVACDRPAARAPETGLPGLLLALAELAAAGVEVDPLPLFAGRDAVALSSRTLTRRPGWVVNGHLVRTADGGYLPNALRPAERVAPATGGTMGTGEREAAVLEYLRNTRDLVAAQRDVLLGFLGTAPVTHSPPAVPAVPEPRPVAGSEVVARMPAEPRPADIRAAVLEVIASHTGYPAEMLGAELELEADLSIDSGRRAEIIGALADRLPAPVLERLARIRTLGEITDWVGGPTPGPADPEIRPPRRQVVRLSELPPLPPVPPRPDRLAGQRVIVVDDGSGVALELADLLEQLGAQVRTPLEVDAPADVLIDLAALRQGGGPVLPGMYGGVRAALLGGARRLLLVTGAGGTFGHRFDGGVGDPAIGAGVRGLARTLAQEFPDVLVRAVDVDVKDAPRALALRLAGELLTEADGPVEVGYEGDTRRTLVVTPQELTTEARLPLGPDGVVLLTGGARGITARVAQAIAAVSGCHVELVGRTPAPPPSDNAALAAAADEHALREVLIRQGDRTPAEVDAAVRRVLAEREIRGTLARLGDVAASVCYHALDVRDGQAVQALVQDIYARHGRLDGVVHGAGLLEDRLVRDKDPESFARVYRTKVDGAKALASAVRPDLSFFVVFGSVAGVYGNRGQADYAAANDACDTLARVWRTELRGRVLVADWGPWAGGGMVAPEPARAHNRRGIALIEPEAAVAALLREIASGAEPQVVFE
jgi:acyl transferase domain-containing protein/NAD(P)H-dependent flavin oxidoreductase YrpB (nitropropane dioxygenase family)